MKLSIIIPTLNEEAHIGELVNYLQKHGENAEIWVCDGGSTDQTVLEAQKAGAEVIEVGESSRAIQMNAGAARATGDVLWFVHADVKPPESFYEDIQKYTTNGFLIGTYRFKFDSNHPILKFLSWCTRFDWEFTRGGDQTIFVSKELWDKLGGYREDWVIMEEYDLIGRARERNDFCIIPKDVVVSSRKYDHNRWWQVQYANFKVFRMYKQGASTEDIKAKYYELLNHPKDYSKEEKTLVD